MSQRRWVLWVGLLAMVVILRWWDPLAAPSTVELVQPVSKALRPASPTGDRTAKPTANTVSSPLTTRPTQMPAQGNLFALRTPPALEPEPPPQVQTEPEPQPQPEPEPEPQPELAPEPPPAPPPPPPPQPIFNVIGTFLKDGSKSVFLATPQGVMQAKVGDTLLGEYEVRSIDDAQVTLTHLPTQQTLVLPTAASPRSPL